MSDFKFAKINDLDFSFNEVEVEYFTKLFNEYIENYNKGMPTFEGKQVDLAVSLLHRFIIYKNVYDKNKHISQRVS